MEHLRRPRQALQVGLATLYAAAKKQLKAAGICPACHGTGSALDPATHIFSPCSKC